MDILQLIKQRRTIRKYQDKPIPGKIIDKIIEAGIWGPSIPSFLRIQPWRFVVVRNKKTIKRISQLNLKKSKNSGAGVNILLHSAADIINGASTIILIYNSGEMKKIGKRFKSVYQSFSGIIENAVLSAISATIQNMILTAETLGVGTCWLDTPLFCKKEINKLLNSKDELIAVLTLGFPAEPGRRAPRKPVTESVRFIK